jgi:hypothetical protein
LNDEGFSSKSFIQQEKMKQDNSGKRIPSLEFSFDTIKKQKHS